MSIRKISVPPLSGTKPVEFHGGCHMSLDLVRSGPATVVTVRGEIDIDNAHLIPELVGCLGEAPLQRLLLDLAQVSFLGAAGIRALLEARRAVMRTGGQLILANPSPIVLTVLSATRLTETFHIHTTRRPRR